MLYFAYGSNMFSRRFQHPSRMPSARAVATGFIRGHQLKFHKQSRDGSAKCDAEYTGRAEDLVHGVLWEIDPARKPELDGVEGLHHGYEEKPVSVHVGAALLDATMYYATAKDASLKPYDWYKGHVVTGAKEHAFPPQYIAMLEDQDSVVDPDQQRSDAEKAI